MIYIGTDIVEVGRIHNNLESNRIKFLNRIFTDQEIKYCNSKLNPAIHFAGRFAGKEAVKKALLSSGLLSNVSMKEIEILPDENIPKVTMPNLPCSIKISISHTDHVAISTAIIIDKSKNV
tara:strand:+ start:298 stop:660 length:363 start_codon:yes stop_codon:yes gene_type:complete